MCTNVERYCISMTWMLRCEWMPTPSTSTLQTHTRTHYMAIRICLTHSVHSSMTIVSSSTQQRSTITSPPPTPFPRSYRQPRFEHMTQLWHFLSVDQKGTPRALSCRFFQTHKHELMSADKRLMALGLLKHTQCSAVQSHGKGLLYCLSRWLCWQRRSS